MRPRPSVADGACSEAHVEGGQELYFYFSLRIACEGRGGNVVGASKITRDISEKKRARPELLTHLIATEDKLFSPALRPMTKRTSVSARCRSADRRQRHVNFANDTRRLERQAYRAMKLMDETLLDEARSKAAAHGWPNRRAPFFLPSQAKLVMLFIDLGSDLNSAGGCRQRTVFDRVSAQLIDRHGKRQCGGSGSFDVRTLNDKPARYLAVEWFNGIVEDLSKLGGFPVGLQK
jgi:hypothetical protein